MRLSIQEQIVFIKNLSVMTKAGVPILDSLTLVKKQSRSKTLTKIIDQLIKDVSNGQFLSTSLERFRNIFGDFAINIIRVGESSGILYENLTYLAEELKKKRELRKKVLGALTYPIIIVVAAIGIVGLLTLYVFPKILPVIENLKGEPPLPTKILIGFSDFASAYWLYILSASVVILVVLFSLISKVKSARVIFHKILLITPILKHISKSYNLATFCRTLGLLLKSDIKVVEALYITSGTLSNLIYKRELVHLGENVSRGEELSRHLEMKSYLFPVTLTQMVAIGERTGNLSETLLYLAQVYEEDLDDLTKNLSTVIEPLLMIILGVIVLFIAISIIAPIYQITQYL